MISSRRKDLYTPRGFIDHAASLRQAFAHCGRFSTAATRRCMDRVSVPSVGVRLSPPLAVIALVGFYPTNKLIARRPLPKHKSFTLFTLRKKGLSGIIQPFNWLFLTLGCVIYVLLPRSPLDSKSRSTCMPYPRRQRSS